MAKTGSIVAAKTGGPVCLQQRISATVTMTVLTGLMSQPAAVSS